jgi:hypothetical protein
MTKEISIADKLKELKREGGKYEKKYNHPIPDNCIRFVGKYMLTYVLEKHPLKNQHILAISKVGGKAFTIKDIRDDIPEVEEVFGTITVYFRQKLTYRGLTITIPYSEKNK